MHTTKRALGGGGAAMERKRRNKRSRRTNKGTNPRCTVRPVLFSASHPVPYVCPCFSHSFFSLSGRETTRPIRRLLQTRIAHAARTVRLCLPALPSLSCAQRRSNKKNENKKSRACLSCSPSPCTHTDTHACCFSGAGAIAPRSKHAFLPQLFFPSFLSFFLKRLSRVRLLLVCRDPFNLSPPARLKGQSGGLG